MRKILAAKQWAMLVFVLLTLGAQSAVAGGFFLPGVGARGMARGGAFQVLADDLTALATNPAGLSRLKGTHLMYNHNLIWAPMTFTRSPSVMANDFSDEFVTFADPLAPQSNQSDFFGLGAFLALSSDFGLDDWTFALGVFGPNASGFQDWDPGGSQRYMQVRQQVLLLYYTLGIAYGHEDKFGVGVSLQYVDAPSTEFALAVDGNPNKSKTPNPYFNEFDLEAVLNMEDRVGFSAIVGAWWRVIPELEVAVSGRVAPVNLDLEGTVSLETNPGSSTYQRSDNQAVLTQVELDDNRVSVDLTLPIELRFGLRYRHIDTAGNEVFDIELDYQYEMWSMVEEIPVDLNGQATVYKSGVSLSPITLTDLSLAKAWRDTHSIRLGGSWNAVPDTFTWSWGGFWESGAVPKNYESVDFPSFMRFGVASGVRVRFYGVTLNMAYMHVFQETREVDERYGKVFLQKPLAPCPEGCNGVVVPANAGKFESSYHQLNLSLGLHFDEWF